MPNNPAVSVLGKIKFTGTGRECDVFHAAGKVIHSGFSFLKSGGWMIRIGFLCGLLFCTSATDAVARVLIHGKASAVHGERVSRRFAPCLQQVFPKHIDRTREIRQQYRMHRSDERFFQDFFHLSPILSKRVDHARKILR